MTHTETPRLGSLLLAAIVVALLLGPIGQLAARVAAI
jgi:hypothetical protein